LPNLCNKAARQPSGVVYAPRNWANCETIFEFAQLANAVAPRQYYRRTTTNVDVLAGTVPVISSEVKLDSPLAYSISEACAVARAGRTALYEAIRSGALTARKRGRKTLILPEDLRRWVESHPPMQSKKLAK
jgi:excisionase family DNA binding protein